MAVACGQAADLLDQAGEHSSSILQVLAEAGDVDDPAPPDVGDGGRAGAGEEGAAVVAAGQGGGEVDDVAVDEPGPVELAGHRGSPLDQDLEDVASAELVEDLVQVALELEGGVDLGAVRAAWPRTTRRGSLPVAWRTVSDGSSARTVPAPTSTASLSARRRWASARASGPVIHRLLPSAAAVRPSRVAANLRTT